MLASSAWCLLWLWISIVLGQYRGLLKSRRELIVLTHAQIYFTCIYSCTYSATVLQKTRYKFTLEYRVSRTFRCLPCNFPPSLIAKVKIYSCLKLSLSYMYNTSFACLIIGHKFQHIKRAIFTAFQLIFLMQNKLSTFKYIFSRVLHTSIQYKFLCVKLDVHRQSTIYQVISDIQPVNMYM